MKDRLLVGLRETPQPDAGLPASSLGVGDLNDRLQSEADRDTQK
jgi:hypothetical protein